MLDQSSVSRAISPDWRREAKARRSLPWEIVKWPERAYALVSLPVTIFKFAMSPYENWQQLAWAAVFLITLAVLGLNIDRKSVV